MRGKTSTCAGLDFVRFGAAALVALYHFAFQERGQTFAVGGWVGVPIFFVISGFVIAFSADQKSAGQFVFSRFLRLYPAAWICATLTAAVTTPPLPNYLGSLVLSPVGPWVSPVYWTLGVEMSFYALVALCVWRWGSASLVPLGIALGAYSAVAWLVKIALNLDAIETQLGYLTLWNNGCLFALGIMLWARRWLIASAFAVVSLCAVAATSKGLALGHMWEAPLIWLVALALIVASVVWRRELEPLAPLARTIGLMTYPLYLIHAEVGGAVLDRTNSILAALAVSILAAFIVLPLERMIRGLFLPRRAQGATLVTPGPETH